MKRHLRLAMAVLLGALASGCHPGPNAKELKAIKDMTSAMKTQCVGRYLFDLPESFVWGDFPEVELYYGLDNDFKTVSVQIVDTHSSEERFKVRVSQRAQSIATTWNEKVNASMLVLDKEITPKKRLIRYFDSTTSGNYHKHEIHLLLAKVHLVLRADSFNGIIEPVENRLLKLSSQIHLMEGALDHQGPGFCLGPLLIDADSDHEVLVSAHAKDKRHPDVQFEIYMSAITPDEGERLPEQVARESGVLYAKPKILRSQETTIGPMVADEMLMRFKEGDIIEHSFAIWSRRGSPSMARPTINLSLTTGGDITSYPPPDLLKYGVSGDLPSGPSPKVVSSSLTDNEAIGLWEAVVKSVRLRPNSVRAGQ